jgi:hypothetical protein
MWDLRCIYMGPKQDVEKRPQLCSRVAQSLNVPQGYASASRSLRPRWMAFLNILHHSCRFGHRAEHTAGICWKRF